MRIFIAGAGAIGLLYGTRLVRAGIAVTMLTRTAEQAERLNAEGAALQEGGETAVVRLQAERISDCRVKLPSHDWIWLTVKQTHLDDAFIGEIARLAEQGASVLCLQNGIGHMPRLREAMPSSPLYAAITTEGALKVDARTVRYTGKGQVFFGREKSADLPNMTEAEELSQKMLLDALQSAGINASLSNEMEDRTYNKLLVNAVINPLTALYGVRNGELPLDPLRRTMMAALHAECLSILTAAGMQGDGDSWQRLLNVCEQTASNESSMLSDVRSGRSTEIDWINGGIAALAERMKMPAPLNDAVTVLIKALRSQ
ncbi:ketopantoate reductase family protein [Paenibacillus spongiae]|uniref:2-dehydropantoate 2-reductase n=1 Tax=Paenibacillus spongiae TaxID=2909671 RepID=A0ABY5SDZ1_9BACL|nr:2-dehydropantoate 2-reductase [Paenibacillus spongiae]UVI32181.1 2-dehydropantoate 2-reductase [Paenibacillus spongiae]